jgi:hypothetical protein
MKEGFLVGDVGVNGWGENSEIDCYTLKKDGLKHFHTTF